MIVFAPVHGGYPGEVIAQDEYLGCLECGWAYPLDQGDDECSECGGLLVVFRAHPAPEATLMLRLVDKRKDAA